MAATATLYAQSAPVAFAAAGFKVLLVDNTYVQDPDAHTTTANITGEVTGTGYTAGGVTLANPTKTYDAATNTLTLDGDNISLANSTITAAGAVVASSAGDLLVFVDFGQDVTSDNGSFTITWDAAGIVTASAA